MKIEFSQCKKTPRQTYAVRETGVSRHHGGTIEGLPEAPCTSQHYHIEGIKGVNEREI